MRRIDPPAPELAKKIYDNFSTTLQMCRAGVSLEGIGRFLSLLQKRFLRLLKAYMA